MIKTGDLYLDNYNSTADIIVNQGGTSCFAGTQCVVTTDGSKSIQSIEVGDIVKCYDEDKKSIEWRKVLNKFKYNNTKRTIKVTLKNGQTIVATEDHKFYYEGGWYSLKYILSLQNGILENY